ncbi:cytochrome c oxidase assembly protein Cox18p, mitochondrial [[Candida] railenensis]|uniref:Cytochrome c oxidase assembly protein Cox18p, mitochondrial n=1 Tax=[Candida] railenensis TaxID=45579 RepID=A0A9P0VZV0_9ASCO|nr:cytochrome c oxidase assembly protein Cox18p, mitochondrial [[Candida] railenensis]
MFRRLQGVRYGQLMPRHSSGLCSAGNQIVVKRNLSVDPQIVVTSLTESMQSLHALTGIPWWALIPIATFSLRAVWTLPLAVIQRRRIQKQNSFKPVISAMFPIFKLKLGQRVQKAKQAGDKLLRGTGGKSGGGSGVSGEMEFMQAQNPVSTMKYEEIVLMANKERRRRQKQLFKDHNIQLWKNFLLPLFQIPLWVSMSLTMRNLSGWSSWDNLSNAALDPSLYEEGLFWFTDLASYDSLHVFPVVLGIVSLCNVEWTFRTIQLMRPTSSSSSSASISSSKAPLRPTLMDSMSNISRMSVVFMMAISMNAPVALVLYWISSQVFSLIQNVILDLNFPMSFTPRKRFNYRKQRNLEAEDVIRREDEKKTAK